MDYKEGNFTQVSLQIPELEKSPALNQCPRNKDTLVLQIQHEDVKLVDLHSEEFRPSTSLVVNKEVTFTTAEDANVDFNSKRLINRCHSMTIYVPAPVEHVARYPAERIKTLLALLFLFLSTVMTSLSLAYIHEKVPDRNKIGPLPDVILDNIKTATWGLDVSEIIITISMPTALGVMILHKHRYIALRRAFVIVGILYLMRSVTMFVTVLPMASLTYYCTPKSDTRSPLIMAKRVFNLVSGFGLSMNGKHTYCGDYIFSGHTVVLTVTHLIIADYSPRKFWVLHWSSWVMSIVGVIFVLVARGHYTIDVIVAYYVATNTYNNYHIISNHCNLKAMGTNSIFTRVWWFPVIKYFEKNVTGPLPCEHEWPLPWPRKWK